MYLSAPKSFRGGATRRVWIDLTFSSFDSAVTPDIMFDTVAWFGINLIGGAQDNESNFRCAAGADKIKKVINYQAAVFGRIETS